MNLIKQIFSYSAANIFNAAVPFFLLPVMTAYLLPEEYGLLSLILMLQTLSLPLVLVNFYGVVIIEYSKIPLDEFPAFISSILVIPILGFIVVEIFFLVFAGYLAAFFKVPVFWVRVTPVFVLLQALPQALLAVFQAEKKPLNFGLFQIFLTVANLSFSVLFVVVFKHGLAGRLWGIFLSFALFNAVALIVLKRKKLLDLSLKITYIKETLKFGVPLIPHSMSGTLLALSDRIFLAHMLSVKDVGIYSVSFQIASIITILTSSVNQAWAPDLFEKLNLKPDIKAKKKLVGQTYKMMLGMFLITILFILFVPFLFSLFVDQKYHDGQVLSVLISVGFLFKGFYFLVTNYIFYVKKTHLLSLMTIISVAVLIGLNFVLVPVYGMYGSAYSMIISWFLFFILTWVLSNKIYPMPWMWRDVN